MTGRMRSLFVYLFVLSSLDAALISQSAIKRCEKNDNNEPVTNDGKVCKKKFVVAMTLKGGQVAIYTCGPRQDREIMCTFLCTGRSGVSLCEYRAGISDG